MAQAHSQTRADKAPISTHPAFPGIVALWFAALLGLGSMVLPVALFETLAGATGLAAIVPGAEPPLGSAARAAIGIAAALTGAAAGLFLARQVARAHAPEQPRPAPERRPISARDELGEEGLGWIDPMPAGRTRRLRAAGRDDGGHGDLELLCPAGALATEEPETAAPLPDGPIPEDEPEATFPIQDQIMTERPSIHALSLAGAGNEPDLPDAPAGPADSPAPQLSVVQPGRAAATPNWPLDERPLEELGLVQLAGRLGAAIETRRTLRAASAVAAPAAPSAASPALAPGAPAEFEAAAPEDAARAIASFFGHESAPAPSRPLPEAFAAEPFAPPPSLRALLVDDEDEADEDAFAGSFSLPLRALASGAENAPDHDPADQGEYSSLLTMKNPFSRHEEFVRGDEPAIAGGDFDPAGAVPPGAPFGRPEMPSGPCREEPETASVWSPEAAENAADSAAPAAPRGPLRDPAQTERDLRAALATLQRISGSA